MIQEILDKEISDEEIMQTLREEAKLRIQQKRVEQFFSDKFKEVEKFDFRVATVLMNANEYGTLRKLKPPFFEDVFNGKHSFLGYIFGAQVFLSKETESFEFLPEESCVEDYKKAVENYKEQ